MRRSESSRYIIVIEFEIITSEKYILTVLILTKPNQQPHLTIISPQARCCSVTLSGMRRTEPNPRKRVVRWGEVRWYDGGEGRRGEERVARSIYVWLVSVGQCLAGPHWSPLVPGIQTLKLLSSVLPWDIYTLHTLLSYLPSPASPASVPSISTNAQLCLTQTNYQPVSVDWGPLLCILIT